MATFIAEMDPATQRLMFQAALKTDLQKVCLDLMLPHCPLSSLHFGQGLSPTEQAAVSASPVLDPSPILVNEHQLIAGNYFQVQNCCFAVVSGLNSFCLFHDMMVFCSTQECFAK